LLAEDVKKREMSHKTDKLNTDEELVTKFHQSAWAQT